jgi:hypothetical protein
MNNESNRAESFSSIVNNSNVKKLSEAFDLNVPNYYMEISNWGLDDSGRIVVTEIKVFDSKGKFLRLAEMKKIVNSIDSFPVSFKRNGS